MALKLKTNYKGASAEYWKILSLNFNALENRTTVMLGLYINKDVRDSNAENFLVREPIILEGEFTRETAYPTIKLLSNWTKAVDC